MKNLSDGVKDGIVIMYCKDGTIYPVGLKQEQLEMLDLSLGIFFQGTLKVINKPLGKVSNLMKDDK